MLDQERQMKIRKVCLSKLFIPLIALTLSASGGVAQTIRTDGTGDWFTGGNWSAGVPNAGTEAEINNSGTAQVIGPGAKAFNLYLGFNAGDSGTSRSTAMAP
jgi:hypothetical protein